MLLVVCNYLKSKILESNFKIPKKIGIKFQNLKNGTRLESKFRNPEKNLKVNIYVFTVLRTICGTRDLRFLPSISLSCREYLNRTINSTKPSCFVTPRISSKNRGEPVLSKTSARKNLNKK